MCFLNIKACQHILLHQIHKIMIFKKASYDPFNRLLTFPFVDMTWLDLDGKSYIMLSVHIRDNHHI